MAYAVQYTISALTGGYALKYSVVLYDAARFESLFENLGITALKGFAADGGRREYEPFETFQSLMKVLKVFAKHGKRAYCRAIVRECDGMKASVFDDVDEEGGFTLLAYGQSGICRRNGEDAPFETITGKTSVYHAEMATLLSEFKVDLMNLLNLCEETIAKDAKIVAQTVPNDTPIPARLVQC